MMLLQRLLAAALVLSTALLFLPALAHSSSRSGLTLCNQTGHTLEYAHVIHDAPLLAWVTSIAGWGRLGNGGCRYFEFNAYRIYLFSLREIEPDGSRKIMRFGVQNIADFRPDSGSYGVEEFFCIPERNDFFEWITDRPEDQCGEGEYWQLFTALVEVGARTHFTFTIE